MVQINELLRSMVHNERRQDMTCIVCKQESGLGIEIDGKFYCYKCWKLAPEITIKDSKDKE